MSQMVIDSHCHIINQREPVWGWGPYFRISDLLEMMDRGYDVMGETKKVEKAIVMTGLGLTSVMNYSIEKAHEYPLLAIKKYPERLFLNPVINPPHLERRPGCIERVERNCQPLHAEAASQHA